MIVVPVFALVAIGYGFARTRLLSDTAYKGLSEYAFGIAMPVLLIENARGSRALSRSDVARCGVQILPMSTPLLALPAALALTVSAFAQQAESPTVPTGDLRHFVIPLHTNLPDPVGGEYGVWSAGPDWKASFHDGFRFHARAPELQQAPSLFWQFESLTVGGEMVELAKADVHWEGRRHETARGTLLERYDMVAIGSAQVGVVRTWRRA